MKWQIFSSKDLYIQLSCKVTVTKNKNSQQMLRIAVFNMCGDDILTDVIAAAV